MKINTVTRDRVRCVLFAGMIVLIGGGTVRAQTTSELALPLSRPASPSKSDQSNTQPAAGVQFCFYREQHVPGVTHPRGVQLSEGGPLQYVLLKPAFTLKPEHVKTCELQETPPPLQDNLDYFTLQIEFSDLGRAKMVEAFQGARPVSFVTVVNDRAFPIRVFFRANSVEETSQRLSLGYFVDREFGQSFVDALDPNAASIRDERAKQLYFPTVAGTKRVMRSTFGETEIRDVTETISGVRETDGKLIVTLQRDNPANQVGYGKPVFQYEYEVSSEGFFLLSTAADGKLATREPQLKLPARVADMWTYKHFDAEQGLTRTSRYTVWGSEVVEVPAGKFTAIPVHKQSVWKRDGEQVSESRSTTWYAVGVGVVKHTSDSDRKDRVTELKALARGR